MGCRGMGQNGGLLGDHAAGMGADVAVHAAAAREQGRHKRRAKGAAYDSFHVLPPVKIADGGSMRILRRSTPENNGKELKISIVYLD